MRSGIRHLYAVVALACLSGAFATYARADEPLYDESAAYAEGGTTFRLNPAGISSYVPSEFSFGIIDNPFQRARLLGSLEAHGFRVALRGAQDQPLDYSLALGGGSDALRQGIEATWLHERRGGRVTNWHYGFLSRPTPWLSIGGVADHLGQSSLNGVRLDRAYDLAIGVRPFALDRSRAHTLGTRLTLTADARLSETQRLDDASFRIGSELELVLGLVVRGSYEDHTHAVRVGFSLGGVHSRATGLGTYDRNGDAVGRAWSVSMHRAESRTVFAGANQRRVAVVRMGGVLGDDDLSGFSIDGATNVGSAATLHEQLKRALDDPLTRGVLLDLRGVGNFAQLEELRPRIARLRAAGKPVVAYLEYGATRGDLYLASACDAIVTTPEAMFAGLGLLVEKRYYRKPLERLGVRIDRTSYGKYKSAYREYSVDSSTTADVEVTNGILDTVQRMFVDSVAAGRHMDRARLLELIDGRSWRPTEVRAAGLVDSIGDRHDAMALLGKLAGLGSKPRGVRLSRRPLAAPEWTVPQRIAVVYASGAISTGRSGNDLLMGPVLGSETLTRQIEAAFHNPAAKAVVLRVESPGGSSVGSQLMQQAIARMKRETKKPLIVSMGRTAASGGYQISLPGDRIYADRFTYTGSIGVLFIRPSLEGLYRKLGVHEEDLMRGDYQQAWGKGRDWDARLQAEADSSVMREYREFVSLVADARKLPYEEAEHNAQGRVWMGDDAVRLKLADEIGGLDAAIAEARRRGGIPAGEKIRMIEYRRPAGSLLQRWAGGLVRSTIEQSARMPEPNSTLKWDGDAIPAE